MKIPNGKTIGLRASLLTICLTGLLVILPLSFVVPVAGALGLAVLALMAALSIALVHHRRLSVLAASQDKLSSEIGILSQRLLKAEAAITVAARALSTKTEGPAVAAEPAAGVAPPLDDGIADVTRDIGLLSGIVRELAEVVSTQESEIGRFRSLHDAAGHAALAAKLAANGPVAEWKRVSPVAVMPFRPPGSARPDRDPEREAALVEAFDGDGLEVWLQPIVSLPQRKVVSYEALARLKVGSEILHPDSFLPTLERHGRTTSLDRSMIRSSAVIARHLQGRGSSASVAYGLSPLSLFEPDFLRSLSGLVSGEPQLVGRVTVTLPQASWLSLDAEQNAVLNGLRGQLGFGLDRPTDLRFDAGHLAERGVSQIKVPAALLLRPSSRESMPEIAVEDLVTAFGRAGIRLVVTDVEREADVPDLIDLDIPLAQGTIFSAAKAVRADVLADKSALPQIAAMPEGPADPETPQPRRAFRDFLRRAV